MGHLVTVRCRVWTNQPACGLLKGSRLLICPTFAHTTMHGQFVWYELISPDPDGAKKFYSPITGWGTQAFDKDYTMWTTGGAPFAGLYRLSPEMRQQGIPPHWMPYVEANN